MDKVGTEELVVRARAQLDHISGAANIAYNLKQGKVRADSPEQFARISKSLDEAMPVVREALDRLEALSRDTESGWRGDEEAWFEAAYRVSSTGMSRRDFIKKYQHHLGVTDEVANRALKALIPTPPKAKTP